MHNVLKQSATVAAVLAMSTVAANAATLSAVSVVHTNDFSTTEVSDQATDGDVSVNGIAGSIATQNADGTSAVSAATPNAFGSSKVTSTAQFSQSETNTFGMDRDYTLSYDLAGQSAEFFPGINQLFPLSAFSLGAPAVVATTPTNPLNPFGNGADELPVDFTQFAGASFEYNIEVNGTLIFNARADALLNSFSPFDGPVIDVESNFVASTAFTVNGFSFSVDAIADDIFLGTFADGEEITVISSLIARAYTPGGGFDGLEIGVNSFSSDPVSLSSIGSLTSMPTQPVNPAAVPLPAAGWMLLAGFGGLAAMKRRKKV